jgi:putative transposase
VTAYGFIQAEKACFPIATMCEVLGVSRSGFYDWRDREPPKRVRADRALRAHVRAAHSASHGTYGSPRIHAELRDQGLRVSRKRIARLMQEDDLSGRPKRKWKRTTDSAHQLPVAPNLLNRDFETEAPNLPSSAVVGTRNRPEQR